ncbi:uncharacterized protein YALI1_B11978g [Yarrowia lipolytica]|uniref:Uncharacterized protein n=1 Tax=Yarrowia lipolytica TaxID=4952 RepID=A0A1D8N731_YARLL|nr:hypothetical protein YALI1_B11978g [Yarrowia lipolytica]
MSRQLRKLGSFSCPRHSQKRANPITLAPKTVDKRLKFGSRGPAAKLDSKGTLSLSCLGHVKAYFEFADDVDLWRIRRKQLLSNSNVA